MKELNVKLRVNMLILEIESALNISDSKFINAEHVLRYKNGQGRTDE